MMRTRRAQEQARQAMYKDKKTPFVLEIDDETDEDMLSVLNECQPPPGVVMSSSDRLLEANTQVMNDPVLHTRSL
jgi:hypothetical protein